MLAGDVLCILCLIPSRCSDSHGPGSSGTFFKVRIIYFARTSNQDISIVFYHSGAYAHIEYFDKKP